MSKEEFLKIQTCVLKVNIHCDGCKQKVKKILQKIDGVYKTNIDSEQGKVTVSGNVDPAMLIKKLNKNGKYAELWGAPKGGSNNNQNQVKNLQIDNGKGGNNNKNGGQNGQKGGAKVGGQNPPQGHKGGFQDMKLPPQLAKDLKLPQVNGKEQKPGKFDDGDGLGYDEFDDDDDDFEDDDDDDGFDDDFGDVPLNKLNSGTGNQMPNVLMNGPQQPQQAVKGGAPNGGNGKKSGGNVPNGNGGKKDGNGNDNNNGGNQNQKGGKNNGPPPQNGGQNKNGGGGGGRGGGNVNNFMANGAKGGGGGMNGMPHMMMPMNPGPSLGSMGNMPMGHMGNPPMGSMNNLAAVQGLPAMGRGGSSGGSGGGGYFPGSGAGPEHMGPNPYYQQQHLAAMMMNQQRANGNERFQPMMYARPPPAVNYMPPYPHYGYPPGPGDRADRADQYSMFSDENASSCTVM